MTTESSPVVHLDSYDRIIVCFSGGKDSLACLLYLLEQGVSPDRITLHHHLVDGREGSTMMDWPVTEAYCQAIAKALGGTVDSNPGPFVLGTAETEVLAPAPWMEPVASFRLAAAHGEQVTGLPPGAEVVGQTSGCPAACYRIGDRVFATQYHPEMTPEFLAALVEEFAPHFPAEVGQMARASLALETEGPRFAEWVARFFERAKAVQH